ESPLRVKSGRRANAPLRSALSLCGANSCSWISNLAGRSAGIVAGRFQPGNLRNCRVRPDIYEDVIAGEHTDAAVIQKHLDRLWRDKPTRARRAAENFFRTGGVKPSGRCGLYQQADATEWGSRASFWANGRPSPNGSLSRLGEIYRSSLCQSQEHPESNT